jgi:putative PEP-CTERM system histidine kinase
MMQSTMTWWQDVNAWLYGAALLAALIALVVSLRLTKKTMTQTGPKGGRLTLLLGIGVSAVWAATLALAFGSQYLLPTFVLSVDSVRMLAWCLVLYFLSTQSRQRQGSLIFVALLLACIDVVMGMLNFLSISADLRISFASRAALAGVVLYEAERLYRRLSDTDKWSFKHFCLAMFVLAAFDFIVFVHAFMYGRIDIALWSTRAVVQVVVLVLVVVSGARNPNWSSSLHLSRQVVFQSVTALLIGIFLTAFGLVAFWLEKQDQPWGRLLGYVVLVLASVLMAVLLLSASIRSKLKRYLVRHFYSNRYDYRAVWLSFNEALSRDGNTQLRRSGKPLSPAWQSLEALAKVIDSPAAALYVFDGQENFRLEEHVSYSGLTACIDRNHLLLQYLWAARGAVDLDDHAELKRVWPAHAVQYVVPLRSNARIDRFVVLAPPRAGADAEARDEVKDLLHAAGQQVAANFHQAQMTQDLLVAKQFDAYNKMAAYVVHDLKNLVAQLNLLSKNAVKHKHKPEFQADMLETVGHVSERLQSMLLQLASGTAPVELTQVVQVNHCLADALRSKPAMTTPVSITNKAQDLMVKAHPDRLARVLGHIIQNADEAVAERHKNEAKASDFVPSIQIECAHYGKFCAIRIEDNGCGMSEEFIRDSLFKPFASSKQMGMGVGMFESTQYLRELGGSLKVESQLNHGTIFTLTLPLYQSMNTAESA